MIRLNGARRLALVCALFAPLSLFGQAGLGSISGEVLDPSGARLPHATLRLVEQSTGIATTTRTNSEGLFSFPSVVVGKYILTIDAPGFKQRTLANLALSAYQQLSLGQITMEVGEGTQTVTVAAEQELVKDSAVRTDAIQSRQVEDTPTAGRNWTTLLKVIPGANAVTSTSGSIAFNGREYTATGYADFRINGKNPQQTQVNLDGGSIVDQGSDAKTTVAPGLESIEEVSVLANNYQAEYGYRAGAVVNIITKSGTNTFHGTAFDNLRNEDLNANSWSNNYLGLPRQKYRYNYVGGNLGGPIRKNRLFFFYNYENFVQSTPAPTTLSLTPTQLERQGDFSQTFNSNGTRPTIYQPGSQFSGSPIPFPNNVIPKNLITPLGTAIMNLFPLPNLQNNYPVNNYALEYGTRQPRFDHTAKVDWNVANNTRMYVRFTDDGGTQVDRSLGGTSGNLTAATFQRPRPDRAVAGNVTHTFSPTLVMEGLVAWSFDRVDWLVSDPTALTKQANGLEDLPLSFKPTNDILPAMTISPYPNFAFGRLPAYSYTDEYQMAANFSWAKGKHLVKWGFLHVRNYKNEVDQSGPGAGNDKGTFDFSSSPSPFDTGYAPSNVLVGAVSSFTQTSNIAHKDAMFTDTDLYLQDTWKLKPNLTLDYGVRMYHMPSQHEIDPANTLDAVFLPSKWDPNKAVRLYVPDPANASLIIDPAFPNNPLPASQTNLLKYTIVPGSGDPLDGVVALGAPGVGLPGILNPKSVLFAPRGGFAWSPANSDKAVIRGGFGWGYNRDNIAQAMNAFENGLSQRADYVQTSFASLSAHSGVQPIPIVSLGARDESSRKVPTVYDYSISVQRELPFQMIADVAYVGNIQRHQPIQFNINAVPLGTAFQPQYVTPGNAGYNFYGPVTASNPGALPGSNAEDASVMRPYPGFGSLTMNENGANVHYNSLQATLGKRFGHGLAFSAAYTYGRTAGQIENIGPYNYNWQNYTGYILANDRAHVLTVNYTYDVPRFARLIRFDNGFGREIFDGWRLAGVFTYFSGAPYSPSFSVQEANTTTNVSLGNVFLGSPDFTPRNTVTGAVNSVSGANMTFNPGALGVPSIYPSADGTGPRNFIDGLGSFTNDFSVVKTIKIRERHAIEIRATAFNLFNNVRRINTLSSLQFKANGATAAAGFSLINTPDQLAASQAAKTNNSLSIYNAYRTGVGYLDLTNVQPMRIVELGLQYRF